MTVRRRERGAAADLAMDAFLRPSDAGRRNLEGSLRRENTAQAAPRLMRQERSIECCMVVNLAGSMAYAKRSVSALPAGIRGEGSKLIRLGRKHPHPRDLHARLYPEGEEFVGCLW